MLDQEKIDGLLASGMHWKAKELLQGRLSTLEYDPQLFEAYGFVLLNMHDDLEAGKYLFLSGVRKPEYSSSIELFLNRYKRGNIGHIYHSFPKAAQASGYSDYPQIVVDELNALGYTHKDTKKVLENVPNSETLGSKLGSALAILFVLALVGGLVAMGFRGLVYLWNFFTG